MFSHKRVFQMLAIFVVAVWTVVPSVKAEHIFFEAAINDIALNSQSPLTSTRLSTSSAVLQETSNTIAANGTFQFTFTFFNTSRFGEGALVSITFLPDPASTLPPPPNQVFNYDGSGTRQNPVIFFFTRNYPTGVFNGLLTVTLISLQGVPEIETQAFPINLISTPAATAVPEPATLTLLATGFAALAARRIRRRRQSLD